MTTQRILNRLTGPKKPNQLGATGDAWHARCKLCRHTIRPDEPRIWLTKPMGLSHQNCATRAGNVL